MTLVRAVLVPIKAFAAAKVRLAPVLDSAEREALARSLAAGVLRAASGGALSVVCDDEEVAHFAESHDARVIWTPGLGLSRAVAEGVRVLRRQGAVTVVVAHADLPRPGRLARFGLELPEATVAIAPDRRNDGTNVIAVPTSAGFSFSYGPGSFGRHLFEAGRLGLATEVVDDDELSLDVDLPADLAYLPEAS
jgi:2-phospho-L-lactate guanylyltransferase